MFTLKDLDFDYGSYEPYIDEATMETHHSKHHAGYVAKLNTALEEAGMDTNRIEDIFENIQAYPTPVRNNAGGHYNHSVFWSLLSIDVQKPSAALSDAINEAFGSFDLFQIEFTKAALSVFGSGWAWLVLSKEGKLEIVTTANQDNPLMSDISGGYPLLAIDVWEHAYYLKHKNKRADYLDALWNLINWEAVSRRYVERPEMSQI